MPNQACANGLHLDVIPQDLCDVFPLEHRLISQRIPFITIMTLRRYGSHYKINGPPVNVPASLNQVINILLRMPNELQLHPLKLKCKLQYKSLYMYDMIHKDKVVRAITWLQVHNKFCANIKLNEEWSALPYEDPLTLLADGAKNMHIWYR